MKNLFKKACVLASALLVGGVSNASTVYPSYGPNSYEFEYEVDYFEPSRSEVDLGTAADGLSLLLRGAQLAFDKNAHPALRTLGVLGMWGGVEIGSRAMGYGSPTASLWKALGAVITPSKDGKYADVEFAKNGKTVKIRMKIIYSENQNILIPVQYNQQPRNFGLSQNDYNNCLSQSFPQHMAQYDYSQIVSQDPDLPTLEEIEKAKLYANNNMPAPEAGTEGNNSYYPQF